VTPHAMWGFGGVPLLGATQAWPDHRDGSCRPARRQHIRRRWPGYVGRPCEGFPDPLEDPLVQELSSRNARKEWW